MSKVGPVTICSASGVKVVESVSSGDPITDTVRRLVRHICESRPTSIAEAERVGRRGKFFHVSDRNCAHRTLPTVVTRIRAERRLGELMAAQAGTVGKAKPPGSNQHRVISKPDAPPTLAEAGIDKNLASEERTRNSFTSDGAHRAIGDMMTLRRGQTVVEMGTRPAAPPAAESPAVASSTVATVTYAHTICIPAGVLIVQGDALAYLSHDEPMRLQNGDPNGP